MSVVGKNIPHDSAKSHVTGESVYIDDIPFMKNELHVDCVGSPYAHGKLKSIDFAEVEKIPGVVACFTHKDLHHNRLGPIVQDEPLLVDDEAMFVGQPIVVIAAETKKALAKAKKAIKIEMEELTPTLTINEAREREEFLDREYAVRRGDVETAFRSAKHTIEGTLVIGGADHFYLESQACLAVPGENDQLVLHSSTQAPSEVQHTAAHMLGLMQSQVTCVTKRMGGGFGGKESQATHAGVMAALVAHKTKRPARMIYIKDDDMKYTGKRHPFQNDYKVAFDDNGVITALKINYFADGGAYNDLSIAVVGRAITHSDNAYFIANADLVGRICRTNLPPNTAFRGFGGPQGVITIENIMEEIAVYLRKDSFEVRRKNVYGIDDRNATPYGQIVQNNTLPTIFDEIERTSEWKRRQQDARDFNAMSQTHLKGLSITAIKFGISFTNTMLNQANALVNVYLDGTVQVSTGATEMGQGVNTNIKMIVADELGIDPDWVIVMPTSTEKNNNTSATAASSATDLNGSAAVNACKKIKSNLAEVAARYFASREAGIGRYPDHIKFEDGIVYDERRPQNKLPFKDIVGMAYRARVSLGERGHYATKGIEFDWSAGKGSPFLYFTMGCAVTEVTIDRFTGDMKVDGIDILMDVGRAINPGITRGQITGAFIQGLGWLTNEELKYTDKGHLLNYSPTTYKIPNIQDMPVRFNVDMIDNYNTPNVRGTKAVGEPPLLLAISALTAVKNALSYISGGQLPCIATPCTNEEILGRISFYESLNSNGVNGKQVVWNGDGVNGTYLNVAGMEIPTVKHGSLRSVSESVARGFSGALVQKTGTSAGASKKK
jgi:xanthine dehydrogenase large subunit